MKTVVNVTFQGDEWDHDERVSLGGRRFRLIRVGASGDAAAAEEQVRRWRPKADAFAVSGVSEARAAGHPAAHEDLQRIGTRRRGSTCGTARCSPTSCRSGRSAASRPRCPATSPTPGS